MSYKLRLRLGSAIGSTILSLFSAVSLVGVDKAQAAVLHYNFQAEYGGSGFFKVDDSSLTGIGEELIAVSEGRLYGFTASNDAYQLKGKDYYNLAGAATAYFYQGEFLGLEGSGGDTAIREINISPDEPGGPYYIKYESSASWNMANNGAISFLSGYSGFVTINFGTGAIVDRSGGRVYDATVSYTLVDTEPSPVPEPLTAGGTALALAGLSWLKHKKKMAA